MRALRLRAAEVLEDEKAAQRWMRTEIIALGMKRPIDVAKSAEGYELCCTILDRLEHGVYS
jgi:putative toxin-antitoxin system antitoxin component (TIGR02293 family)